jgi:hypothetical protein
MRGLWRHERLKGSWRKVLSSSGWPYIDLVKFCLTSYYNSYFGTFEPLSQGPSQFVTVSTVWSVSANIRSSTVFISEHMNHWVNGQNSFGRNHHQPSIYGTFESLEQQPSQFCRSLSSVNHQLRVNIQSGQFSVNR